jgi:hypothetical protein
MSLPLALLHFSDRIDSVYKRRASQAHRQQFSVRALEGKFGQGLQVELNELISALPDMVELPPPGAFPDM